MTEKELHKLRRQDLLELLLSQSKEVARQKNLIAALQDELTTEKGVVDHLKERLDGKDEKIHTLEARLGL